MTSREVDLLKEIAELKQIIAAILDEKKKVEIEKQIQQKQVEFKLMMERQNVNGGKSKINGSRQRLSGDTKYIHP